MFFSFIYPAIRKPFILKNHYIETNDSTYANKEYRSLLWTEILFSSFICAFSGTISTPFFIAKDLWNIENTIRKIEKNGINKYHRDFIEVLIA